MGRIALKYPGLVAQLSLVGMVSRYLFFLSILAFNLWGEGLRRFIDETHVNLRWIFSRYTLAGGTILLIGAFWLLRSGTPVELYQSQALQFNAQNTVLDIEVLTSEALRGRESGSQDAHLAAQYIAARMEEIGLFPGGADVLTHTPADSIENIDYAKLQQTGQTVTLTVTLRMD